MSSLSQRPASSLSQRTDGVFQRPSSHRPPSSAATRPPSSALRRPASGASIRPTSRLSQKPGSRQSRPATKQTSRLLPQYQALVTQVTGLATDDNDEKFEAAVEFVSKSLELTATGADMASIDRQIRGCVWICRYVVDID